MAMTALAAFAAGCQKDLIPDFAPGGEDRHKVVAIAFDNGFVDNAVATRGMLPLCDFQDTMGVWGWRSDGSTVDEPLFIDQLISYDRSLDDWTYLPPKYWELNSTYRFYAYSPHVSNSRAAGASVSIDPESGLISIDGVKLQGDSTDIDWMVARQGQTALGRTAGKVQFVMDHILAKLNVRMCVNASMLSAQTGVTSVRLDSMSIGTFSSRGRFDQKLTHTPSAWSEQDMAAVEWTVTDSPAVSLASGKEINIGKDYTYVLDKLLLPQNVTGAQVLKLRYSLTFSDGRCEHFDYVLSLDSAFGTGSASGADGRYLSGYSYTLSLTVSPNVITFNARTSAWTDKNDI